MRAFLRLLTYTLLTVTMAGGPVLALPVVSKVIDPSYYFEPHAIAVDQTANKIYVLDRWYYELLVIDGGSDEIEDWFYLEGYPVALACNPNTGLVYAATEAYEDFYDEELDEWFSYTTWEVWEIDTVNNWYTLVFSSEYEIQALEVNPQDGIVYIADEYTLYAIELDNYTELWTAWLYGYLHGLAYNPQNNRLYLSRYWDDGIEELDAQTGDAISDYETDYTGDIDVSTMTGELWMVRDGLNAVSIYDPNDNYAIRTSSLSSEYAWKIAVNGYLNEAYVTDTSGTKLHVVSGGPGSTLSEDSDGSVELDYSSYYVALNPVTGKIYVTHSYDGIITVLQTEAGGVDTIPPVFNTIGMNPFNVDKGGDFLSVFVDVWDNVGVVRVTADGVDLEHNHGTLWIGQIDTDPEADYGYRNFPVVAWDAVGNYSEGNGTYNVSRTLNIPISEMSNSILSPFLFQRVFQTWGRVTSLNGVNSFYMQNPSSPKELRVSVNDHNLSVGDFIIVRGQLYGYPDDLHLWSRLGKMTNLSSP